jgi:branched-chain amino acid transport system permease protein
MDTAVLLQFIITGISVGCVYALIAIGFVTIYNITGIINFAQGEFVMIGAMTCITFYQMGWGMLPSIVCAIIVTSLVGGVMELSTIRPARNASFITLLIITIGASTLLRGLALWIWGDFPKALPAFSASKPLLLGGAVIVPQYLWIFGILIIMLALLYLFFEKTVMGAAVKACVINPRAAQLMGINTRKMSTFAFVASAAIGAIAGIVIAPITSGTYEMGVLLGLKGFVAMVLGGMTSIPGAVIGAVALGLIESLVGGYFSTKFSDAISFLILIITLVFFRNSLFGTTAGKRV